MRVLETDFFVDGQYNPEVLQQQVIDDNQEVAPAKLISRLPSCADVFRALDCAE